VLSADFVAGSGAELGGVGLSGVLVGAFGVPWSILGLGASVTAVAALLWRADHRDATRPPGDVTDVVDVAETVEAVPTSSSA
jgi:hypothetical protein